MKPKPTPASRRKTTKWPGRVSRWQLILLAVLSPIAIFLVVYASSAGLREQADDWYFAIYARLYVDAPLTELAVKHANLAYCRTSSRFQKLDLYVPKRAAARPPIVVYIHGGGWSVGDKSSSLVAYYGQPVIDHGVALASINYRLAPHNTYPVQNQDVACAIRYLQDNAATYGLDGSRIALFGDSAGGQLAAMAAFDPQFKPIIKAVVQFYSPSDLWVQVNHKPHPDKRVVAYLGSATNPALAKQASPLYHVPDDPPPFLLFHGTNDQTVPYSQSVDFAEALTLAGGQAKLVAVHNANHYIGSYSQPNRAAVRRQMTDFLTNALLPF